MEINSRTAAAALASADRSSSTMSKQTRALRWTMALFAVVTTIGLVLVGLAPRPAGLIAGTVMIVGAGSALGAVGATSRALPQRFRRRYAAALGLWAFLYVAVLLVGMLALPGSVAFWVTGAIICAAPGLWFAVVSGMR